MSFISIRGLAAGYGKARVLRGVDLDMDDGESLAIIGKNGAGKSTLLNSLFGASNIFEGSIELAGTSLRNKPGYVAAKLGATISPQGRLILPHLSVRENLLLGQAAKRPGRWTLKEVYDLFPVLQERRDKSGTALSGGQQQMLAIGRALMGNPRVLVLDEPSEGLSPLLVDNLARVLLQIRATGTGVLLVEQHLKLVRRVSQRFAVMAKGEIIDRGRMEDIDLPQHQAALGF